MLEVDRRRKTRVRRLSADDVIQPGQAAVIPFYERHCLRLGAAGTSADS
jgi:hypothetical protein